MAILWLGEIFSFRNLELFIGIFRDQMGFGQKTLFPIEGESADLRLLFD
jgi:hypothetical protein